MKIFLVLGLLGLGVLGVERKGHHHRHHNGHSVSEILSEVEKSLPQLSEKQRQAMSKFEDHKIFKQLWSQSHNRLEQRMREVEERRRKKHRY